MLSYFKSFQYILQELYVTFCYTEPATDPNHWFPAVGSHPIRTKLTILVQDFPFPKTVFSIRIKLMCVNFGSFFFLPPFFPVLTQLHFNKNITLWFLKPSCVIKYIPRKWQKRITANQQRLVPSQNHKQTSTGSVNITENNPGCRPRKCQKYTAVFR